MMNSSEVFCKQQEGIPLVLLSSSTPYSPVRSPKVAPPAGSFLRTHAPLLRWSSHSTRYAFLSCPAFMLLHCFSHIISTDDALPLIHLFFLSFPELLTYWWAHRMCSVQAWRVTTATAFSGCQPGVALQSVHLHRRDDSIERTVSYLICCGWWWQSCRE